MADSDDKKDSEETKQETSDRPEEVDEASEETPEENSTDEASGEESTGEEPTAEEDSAEEASAEESTDEEPTEDDDGQTTSGSDEETPSEASSAASADEPDESDSESEETAETSADGGRADDGDGGGGGDGSDEPEDDDGDSRVVETVRERRPDADDERIAALADELEQLDEEYTDDRLISASVLAIDADVQLAEVLGTEAGYERRESGVAAFFDHPDRLLAAARKTRDSKYEEFDAYSPFPIHGMDEAMGLERSWIPWVTFAAGLTGFLCAVALEFGTMTFDWPIIIGGKPYAPWPAFVPVMFELTVLIGGVTTGVVMLRAAGCFAPADVIDPDITDDRFALWISGEDDAYDQRDAIEFVEQMNPDEVRTFTEES